MNSVKQFQQSHLLALEHCEEEEQVKALLVGQGITTDSISTLFAELIQFATIGHFNLQQKLRLLNLALQLLCALPAAETKADFHDLLTESAAKLTSRDQNCKLSFSLTEAANIRTFLSERILPYYQLYEIVLDNHPHFTLQAKPSDLVKTVSQPSLASASPVEVEDVDVLKQFLGVRAAKEQKKDLKKK